MAMLTKWLPVALIPKQIQITPVWFDVVNYRRFGKSVLLPAPAA